MDNMELVIQEFFTEYAGLNDLTNGAVIVSRRDGVPLYSHKGFSSDWSESTVSALVGGMWQAAEAMTDFIPYSDNDEFRFSFDSTSRGIYIIKLVGEFEPLYLSYIYFDQVNPAKIKARVKSLQNKLSFFIEENLVVENNEQREAFLFDNISDDEMDNLFAGIGG